MTHTQITIGRLLLITLLMMDFHGIANASTFDSLTSTVFDTIDDAGYSETSYGLRFGSTVQKELSYNTTTGRFSFDDDLRVGGTISGSSLNIDRNATVGGSLTVTGTILTKSALSGRILIVSGAASFSGSVKFKQGINAQGVLSGNSLRVSAGGADIHGPLNVTGAIRTDSDLTLGADDAAADVTLTFMNSGTDEVLTWLDTTDRFSFSNDVRILGNISGSSLTIDNSATISGTLLVKNALTSKTTISGTNLYAVNSLSGKYLYASSTFGGAGLSNCTGASSKVTWLSSTKRFSCENDETGGSSGMSYATASGIFLKRGGGTVTGSILSRVSTGSLTTLSGADLSTDVLSLDVVGNYAYVGMTTDGSTRDDLRIFDVRNPLKPTRVGGVDLSASANEIMVVGRYAYLGLSTGNEFSIYDISRPSAPVLMSGLNLGANPATALYVAGHYAYVTTSTISASTMSIIDISDPRNPKVVGSLAPSAYIDSTYVTGRTAYVTRGSLVNPSPGAFSIDITNPSAPAKLYFPSAAGTGIGSQTVTVSGKYAYVGNNDIDGGVSHSFEIDNIANPTSISSVSTFILPGVPNAITVAGRYAYVGMASGAWKELFVFDISTPTAPRFVTSYEMGAAVNRLVAHGKQLYIGLSTVSGNDFVILDVGGIETSHATIGSLLANLLSVSDNATIANDLAVGGAIEAGYGIHANGFSTVTSGSGGYTFRIIQQTSRTGALAITANGSVTSPHIVFGSGSAFDTTLFRSAATTLKTNSSFFALGTISGANIFSQQSITGTYINATSTFAGAGLANCTGTSNKLTWLSSTKRFSCETDETGGDASGGISQTNADARYVNTAGDTMTGGLTIRVTTADVVKTTSGTSLATDFSVAGSTLLNVISSDDTLTISSGAVPASGQGVVESSTIATTAAVGSGAFTIIRTDGQTITVHGNTSTTGSRWDGVSGTMTSVAVSTVNVGPGATGLYRTDGRWLIVHGAGATSSTIFDPYGVVGVTAGPTLTSCTATTGTNAFLVSSGTYVIMCGGSGNWGVYNTRANTYLAGTAVGVSFGAGAHALQRDDGTFLVFSGGASSSHYIYTPWGNPLGTWSAVNPIASGAPTISNGAFSIRRADGKFLIVGGAAAASTIYDPRTTSAGVPGTFTAQSGTGQGPTVALADGASAMWRPDGKYLMLVGRGTTTTNIIDPSANGGGQFIAGPALGTAVAAGGHMIISNSGSVRIFAGGNSTTTMQYKMGFVVGGPSTSTGSIYESECITSSSLNSGSTLAWNASADDFMTFQVRTGNGSCPAGTTGYKTIAPDNGRLIRPNYGDNRVQLRVIFRRPLPRFADQEWGLRRGVSQTRYRRVNKDPALYDIAVRNTNLLRRTQFEFGNSLDASGPVSVNIANDRNKNMQIQLISLALYASTQSSTSALAHAAEGTFIRHNSLAVAAGMGTIVMKRPDGKFIVIGGRASPNSQLYDQNTQTFTAQSSVPSTATGTGALAFKRPDGKFLIVPGAGQNKSILYDPLANTYTNGPLLTGIVGEGALPIPLPNGRVLVVHGGFQKTTSIYDPYQNIFLTGATVPGTVGRGTTAFPKPDGTWMLNLGIETAACTAVGTRTNIFDPYSMKFYNNTGIVHVAIGPGSFTFQRADGNWVMLPGEAGAAGCKLGALTTSIFNMKGNKIVAGPVTARRQGRGMAIPRPDGTWLILNGSGAKFPAPLVTSIYQETSGAFTADGGAQVGTNFAGPNLIYPIGSGAVAFQRDDGKFVIISGQSTPINGAGSGTVQLYDAGWISNGFYRTENMYVSDLDSDSTLSWKSNDYSRVSAEVRTATSSLLLQTKEDRPIAAPGGFINPNTSEKYVQVEFSLKRTFPSYGGIWEDVWYNGGVSPPVIQRTIPMPTISEFSINKDKDLVDMQADRLSLFRVSSNGDIYSGAKGSINTGGADLAERYFSEDDLKPGELVGIDYLSEHGVRLTKAAYQWDLLGVVSTNPGFVAGAFTLGSHPIALVGRVPVWVSLENGDIAPGDHLTSSAILGTAMKATKAGRVVGVALSATDPNTIQPCPRDEKKMCSKITMFVDLSDWPGPQ